MSQKTPQQIENRPAMEAGEQAELKTLIASYERGGWTDGRLGVAFDLIWAILLAHGHDAHKHQILADIETLDETLKGAAS